MPDSNTTQESSTAQTTDDTNASTSQANTETVSKAEFLELKNSLARLIRQTVQKNEQKDASTQSTTTDTIEKPSKKTAAEIEIAARLKAIEESHEKQKKSADRIATNAKRGAVKAAFASMGLVDDPKTGESKLSDATDLFFMRNGASIGYDDENDRVTYTASAVDEPVSLNEWFAKEDASGRFKALKAKPTMPTKGVNRDAGATSGGNSEMTLAEFTAAQLSGKYSLADLQKIGRLKPD